MKIGQLKHRITIKRLVSSINENGFETESYENFKVLWANVSNLHGKEYFEAAKIQKEKTVKFTCRSIKAVDETMKIAFNDKLYDIIFIDNVKYENKYMEIHALEVNDSG